MAKTKKNSKVINLCERYPNRFPNADMYKASKNPNFSPKDIEAIDTIIAEMVTNIFYLLFEKIR